MGAETFGHPYEPYDIQKDFMNALYELLCSEKKVGLFESPTGTGKTLSLMCPSLTWLRNLDKRKFEEQLAQAEQLKGPEFIRIAAKKKLLDSYQRQGQALRALKDTSKLIAEEDNLSSKRKKYDSLSSCDDYLLEDPVVEPETQKLLEEMDSPNELESLSVNAKIYFASRTHSQLSQFVGALKGVKVDAIWSEEKQPMRHVPLGSRKQLCVNPSVTKLSTATSINEKCQDLRQKHACPFYENSRTGLKQSLMTDIMDIEDLQLLGKKTKTCSYYAARETVPYAEVITLPYQLVMQESTRKTLGLDLRDSLVIIDEAHNIADTITSLNSITVSRDNVSVALKGLEVYYARVGTRLSTQNVTRLNQTILVVKSLAACFDNAAKAPPKAGTALPLHELFAEKNVDTINLWTVRDWITSSKLVFKLDTYIRQEMENSESLVLAKVVDFLLFATDPAAEGKLFWDKTPSNELALSFLSLDASLAFGSVVEEASKVVLAGGTMEPFSDFRHNLFPQVEQEMTSVFSCGHIVPKSSILVRVVPGLELTFARRQDTATIKTIGETLLKISKVVPAGLVVFFPSYSYLELAKKVWASSGIDKLLANNKKLFEESKTESVEQILASYQAHISKTGHAMMYAVVGGKLSEGINFSDDLARGVVMIGLPFPNAFSAEMIAKRDYIEKKAKERGLTSQQATQYARESYENLSMRAVNQSVGRAIRHIKDYAAIYLIDDRYTQSRISSKLSGWLRDSVEVSDNYLQETAQFFKARKI